MERTRAAWLGVAAIGLSASVLLGAQRWRSHGLRTEIAALQLEAGELAHLQVEYRRLQAKRISADEVERLRADHAALPRLRAEIEELKERARVAGR